jgi:hypothetical protein
VLADNDGLEAIHLINAILGNGEDFSAVGGFAAL